MSQHCGQCVGSCTLEKSAKEDEQNLWQFFRPLMTKEEWEGAWRSKKIPERFFEKIDMRYL